MIFHLKDADVQIRCDHAPLCKLIYSLTKNDKCNNWLQEIHVITSYVDFENIKGRDSILADSLSRLKAFGFLEANDPKEA